jgi:hypothetical protein
MLLLRAVRERIGSDNVRSGMRLISFAQNRDQPDYEGLLELFPQNYHEPYYRSYIKEDFRVLASGCDIHSRRQRLRLQGDGIRQASSGLTLITEF